MTKEVTELFVDLETTGLEIGKDKILEIAAIAVDSDKNEIARFHEVIPVWPLASRLVPWTKETHTANGLLGEVEKLCVIHEGNPLTSLDGGMTLSMRAVKNTECRFIDFLADTKFKRGQVVMCGHSIAVFDRLVLLSEMPLAAAWFSYRTIDYGQIARYLTRFNPQLLHSPSIPHRAMLDCEIELEEARRLDAILKKVDWHV
jgi:oligoribonuclease